MEIFIMDVNLRDIEVRVRVELSDLIKINKG